MNYLKRCVLLLGLLFFSVSVWADAQSPVVFIQGIANQMISHLDTNKAQLKQPGVIRRIVNQVLIPRIDLDRMAGSVVGRQYWMSATPQQKSTFIREFTSLVISTYSAALASYDQDRVNVFPFRGNYSQMAVVNINSMLVRRSGQRIPISYNIVRKGGGWKIYDFSIENISMIQSYRSQFADVLSQSGMAGLIQKLSHHNHRAT